MSKPSVDFKTRSAIVRAMVKQPQEDSATTPSFLLNKLSGRVAANDGENKETVAWTNVHPWMNVHPWRN